VACQDEEAWLLDNAKVLDLLHQAVPCPEVDHRVGLAAQAGHCSIRNVGRDNRMECCSDVHHSLDTHCWAGVGSPQHCWEALGALEDHPFSCHSNHLVEAGYRVAHHSVREDHRDGPLAREAHFCCCTSCVEAGPWDNLHWRPEEARVDPVEVHWVDHRVPAYREVDLPAGLVAAEQEEVEVAGRVLLRPF
jgi:hypothetical protein